MKQTLQNHSLKAKLVGQIGHELLEKLKAQATDYDEDAIHYEMHLILIGTLATALCVGEYEGAMDLVWDECGLHEHFGVRNQANEEPISADNLVYTTMIMEYGSKFLKKELIFNPSFPQTYPALEPTFRFIEDHSSFYTPIPSTSPIHNARKIAAIFDQALDYFDNLDEGKTLDDFVTSLQAMKEKTLKEYNKNSALFDSKNCLMLAMESKDLATRVYYREISKDDVKHFDEIVTPFKSSAAGKILLTLIASVALIAAGAAIGFAAGGIPGVAIGAVAGGITSAVLAGTLFFTHSKDPMKSTAQSAKKIEEEYTKNQHEIIYS
ncbi:hypothetical protein [Legionella septentrionalis]|uniref:hypothetical protein n=1 Tax=Legionella septentrionalis TaxID=2498109 RepID=UPI000F8CB485|nr:hypothetical protein [Legionella septentrionalis]RUR12509.1 hypothetical protein ELY10_11510 [Legionella septentrionalis]